MGKVIRVREVGNPYLKKKVKNTKYKQAFCNGYVT